jgi:hypothetical protein
MCIAISLEPREWDVICGATAASMTALYQHDSLVMSIDECIAL